MQSMMATFLKRVFLALTIQVTTDIITMIVFTLLLQCAAAYEDDCFAEYMDEVHCRNILELAESVEKVQMDLREVKESLDKYVFKQDMSGSGI